MPIRHNQSQPERTLYSTLRKLLCQPGIVRGNLVNVRRQCGKSTCKCISNPDHRHPALYLGISMNGKQRMIYIPADWGKTIQQWVDQYAQIQTLLEKLSLISLKKLQYRKEK